MKEGREQGSKGRREGRRDLMSRFLAQAYSHDPERCSEAYLRQKASICPANSTPVID